MHSLLRALYDSKYVFVFKTQNMNFSSLKGYGTMKNEKKSSIMKKNMHILIKKRLYL
jgi:hypothetical protein